MSVRARVRGMMRRARGVLVGLGRSAAPDRIVRVLGHRMILDEADSLDLARNGAYELPETRLVQSTVREGDIVVDVGANIGYYTLLFARLVGRSGRVYAFEPDSTNFSILERNVALNGYDNVVPVPMAVSSHEGTVRLFLSDHNAGMHRSYPSIVCGRSVPVEAIRLDEFFRDERRGVEFIKMDIEGAEPPALEGMRALLRRSPGALILSEYSPAAMWEAGSDPEGYIAALIDLGFGLHTIREDGSPAPIDIDELRTSTRRIVAVTEEVLRPLGGHSDSPSDVIATIAARLREAGHRGSLTRNLLCVRPSRGTDADHSL